MFIHRDLISDLISHLIPVSRTCISGVAASVAATRGWRPPRCPSTSETTRGTAEPSCTWWRRGRSQQKSSRWCTVFKHVPPVFFFLFLFCSFTFHAEPAGAQCCFCSCANSAPRFHGDVLFTKVVCSRGRPSGTGEEWIKSVDCFRTKLKKLKHENWR